MWAGDRITDEEYSPLIYHPGHGKLHGFYSRFRLKWIISMILIGFVLAVLLGGSIEINGDDEDDVRGSTEKPDETPPAPPSASSEQPLLARADLGTPKPILFLHSNKNGDNPKLGNMTSSNGKVSFISVSDTSQSPTVSPSYVDKPSFWNGTFRFEGGPTSTLSAPTFGSVVTNKADVLKVELLNVTVDALLLSKDLEGCTNLKAIVLSNVFIKGEFQRVLLPSLELFIFQQLGDTTLQETKENYQDSARLKSRLFFDKVPGQTWDLKKDIANLETKIEFGIDGVTLLKISQTSEEIVLYVPYCDEILQTVSWTLSTLTLVRCNISASSIPVNLIYFNVYKVQILNGGNFTQIIKTFNRLTDFYAQIPGEVINLSDFPPTLTTLTVIDTDLDYRNDYRSTILNLGVGYHLGPKVLECIDKIMSTVQRVAVFGIPDEIEANILLQKLLLNTTAQWIVFEDFQRNPNSNFPIQQWVEQFLTNKLGIPANSSNFLITLNRTAFNGFSPTGSKSGRELTPYEIDYYHYVLLGWYKTTTFEAYSAIQKRKLENLKNGR